MVDRPYYLAPARAALYTSFASFCSEVVRLGVMAALKYLDDEQLLEAAIRGLVTDEILNLG